MYFRLNLANKAHVLACRKLSEPRTLSELVNGCVWCRDPPGPGLGHTEFRVQARGE